MNIKTAVTSFVILTFPLFVYGQVSIAESGSATDKKSYTLFCNVTSFTGSATWTKDGTQLTTCVSSSFCSVDVLDVYTFSSNASGIQVVMNPVSSTIDGLWICTSSSGHFQELNVTSIRSLERSTTFESSPIIEPTSASIFVESNAGISPTDVSQLNTSNIFSFSSDVENFSSSIFTSDRKHTSASLQTDNFETIDTTNALFFMNTTSSIPNSVLSSMSLMQNLDSYKISIQSSMIKTVTISPLNVTIESGYQSTSSYFAAVSLFSETTIGLLTSGLYITTPEISSGLVYSVLGSSFSATTEVYPTSTFTETLSIDMTSTETVSTDMTSTKTVSIGMTSSDMMFDIVTEGNETTFITSITAANVFTRDSLSDDIPVLQTTFDSITTTWSPIYQSMETLITSTAMSNLFTLISEEAGFSSSFTLETPRSTNIVLAEDEYESMMTSKLVYQNTSVFALPSGIIPTNNQSSSEISLDSYSVSTFISFLTTHEGPLIYTNDPSFFKTESDMGSFNSSLVNQNFLLSQNAISNYINEASDSQYNLSNPESSGSSSSMIFEQGDFSAISLSYSYVIDTVKHTSDFVMTSPFNEQSVSVTQSSLTIKTFIQTSPVQKTEAGSAFSENHSSLPTKLFSSIPDEITETVSSTNDDKFILATSTDISLVASSLNTLDSFSEGMEDSVFITKSFVQMISRSSNELATASSSLETLSPNLKTTTKLKHGISESSKDAIFISVVSGTIGVFILVVLIAMVVSGHFMKRNKFKDNKKEDEISNQLGWSDDGGMNSYNKNYTSREYIFSSGSIHLPLNSYESPYFPYANNYKTNWDANT